MITPRFFVALLTFSLSLIEFGVGSRTTSAAPPAPPLQIRNVFVVFGSSSQTITIWGENFNSGSSLNVTLGAQGNVGDISSACTPNFSAVPQQISCSFGPILPAGDYLLKVS